MKHFCPKGFSGEISRRQLLRSMVCASPFLLPGVLGQCLAGESPTVDESGTSLKPPHFPARATSIATIHIALRAREDRHPTQRNTRRAFHRESAP